MFIKFHKTGSTTLISALTREGCKHKLTMCNMLCNAKPLGSQRQDSCNAWGGDYATGAFRQGGKPLLLSIFPRATTFVTLLRHPVERLWSRYQNNLARGSTRSFDQLIAAEGHDYQLTLTHGNSTNLDLALLTLRQFDVVGITEDFDGFIVLFQLKMGWPMTSLVYQVNKVTSSKQSIPDHIYRSLTTSLTYEFALYDEARRLYDRQKAEPAADFASNMNTFRRAQATISQTCQRQNSNASTHSRMLAGKADPTCMAATSKYDKMDIIPPCTSAV